jgi:outer membrane protein OmpA-like peptidoglycan-associated protein
VLGWIEGVPRIESDLEGKSVAAATKAGFSITADFSGQDGKLRCTKALDDAERSELRQLVEDIKGVRVASFDAGCVAAVVATPTPSSTTTTTPSVDETTAAPVTTEAAVTTTAQPATAAAPTTTPAAAAASATAAVTDGRVVLTGKVTSDAQRQAVFDAAAKVVAAENIDNQIAVADDAATDDATIAKLGTLIAAMKPNLVSGEAGVKGTSLYAKGVYVDDAAKSAYQQAASGAGVTAELTGRQAASTSDAAALEKELNDIVALNPILFDVNQATIKDESQATLDRVATVANKYTGTAIAVQGHTDSDGTGNDILSEARAAAVLDALVSRGVAANQLTSVGFGESQPIIENGVENKEKSRRVVFAVTTT